MKNLNLPDDLRKKVVNYLRYTESNLDHQRELGLFEEMVSPSLKLEVHKYIFQNVMLENPIFFEASDGLIDYIVSKIDTKSFPPEEQIIV